MYITKHNTLLWLFTIILLMCLSCNNQPKQVDKTTQQKDTAIKVTTKGNVDISKYYTTKDTMFIPTEIGYTLWYTKRDFNQIIDEHHELTSDYVNAPDLTYYQYGSGREFGSETGIDAYYILYAYFLKQKNGINNHAVQRNKLINIYSNINSCLDILSTEELFSDIRKEEY